MSLARTPHGWRFLAACRQPERQQRALLAALVARHATTAFGRHHALSPGMSLADFRAAVPIRPHAELQPWIDRAMDGEPGLTLTGQLGDVMKESARIALSYVESHTDQLQIDPTDLKKRFHVHVPAGAVPKDGPSAGIAMVTSLASLLTGRPARPTVAMTGEITLRGKVLPVGGIKEKILAAKRAGIERVVVPERNRRDVAEVPAELLEGLDLEYVGVIDEVLQQALLPAG